jgi:hypothetical protein
VADLSRREASHQPEEHIISTSPIHVLKMNKVKKEKDLPLSCFCVTRIISSFLTLSSPSLCPAKSYSALYVGSFGATGGPAAGGGGGGGGGIRPVDAAGACPVPFDSAATGCGTALGCGTAAGTGRGCGMAAGVGTARGCGTAAAGVGTDRAAGVGTGLGCAGRDASFVGPPPGPPGRRSLPFEMGFAAICLPFGVGFETEFGGSPGPVWMVPDL